MKPNFLTPLVESGTEPGDTPTKRRGVILSNYISLILIAVNVLLFIIIPQNHNLGGLTEALFGMALFSIPIFLNRVRFLTLSRLILCWLPPLLIFWIMIIGMKETQQVPSSSYNGLRIYLLATGCIPYLLLERRPVVPFVLGVVPSLFGLFFCDYWLNLAGVGYDIKGSPDSGYGFAPVRGLIAYIVISGSCLALRFIVDKTDRLNQELIAQLEKSNTIIKQQAENELNKLNQKLITNIKEIWKREFTLRQSQEIAKVGSWEFNHKENSVFWSDEMYDIFGVDKALDLNDPKLAQILFGDSSILINEAHKEVIEKMKPYDFTLQTKTPLGYLKWVRVAGFPLILDEGAVGITGIVHDVTLFKEAEERVKANEKNYRSLFEQANDGIMLTDFNGNFFDVNSSMCRMLGYTREELVQMNIVNLIDPEQLKTDPIKFDWLAIGDHIVNERNMIRKDGTMIQVEANIKMFSEGKIMAIVRDITSRKAVEREREKIRFDLNERVKELSTLYKASQLLEIDSRPMHETLQEITSILPQAWQYPDIAAARISLAGMEFVTPNYSAYKHRQFTEFITRNGLYGTVEVVYLEDRTPAVEGPFLAEERHLIDMMANMIEVYLSRRYETETLKRTEANQSATINNSNFFIWSVNREYEFISFNKLFADFAQDKFGVEPKVGTRLGDGKNHSSEIKEQWIQRYNRALAGETFKVVSELDGRQYEYSLNPIIEESRIIGATVFGEDITERLKQEKEIQEANKLIGELQLMGLRSAMNPHFIFNSLNAIQYYIMENDTKSAVTYLSTFSKLIRAILSNSIKNKVRLAEELDMIRNYIQMESMRFDHKFDSIINVDRNVDVENVEIPSMLIQPYVENAIIHGLYNKREQGTLKISVSIQNGMMLFEIEDDGVGRKASEQSKQLTLPKHKSLGTALTEERLKLINPLGQATVEIIDLDAGGKPTGTKVNIWVKYEGV